MSTLVSAFGLVVLLAIPVRLGDVEIADNDQKGIRDCKGGNASIAGNDNKLTLKNCATVSVAGNDNKLVLEGTKTLDVTGNDNKVQAGPVQSISTTGNNNKVTYKKGPKKPKISNVGNGNKIQAG